MTENKSHEGGCQCGRVRYKADGAPINTTNCHCTQCRMAAGAPYVTWTEFPTDRVTFGTQPPQYFRASNIAERGFCPDCGTALTFRFLDGEDIDLATVTFDDPAIFAPQDHVWTASKIAWVRIDDGLPQYARGRDGQ